MDGKHLKSVLIETRYSLTELGRRLGMSQQAFSQALNVKDIKTGFLEKLCEALDVKMSFFYPDDYDKPTTIVNANRAQDTAISTGSGSATASSNPAESAMVKALMEQNKQLLDLIQKLASKQ